MLTLFRKLRHKLLHENKFGKYFTYAIGEIVLVVVGILIALQINNWNQEKQNKNFEHTMLRQMKVAMEEDVASFEKQLGYLQLQKSKVYRLATVAKDPNYPQDSLRYYFREVRRSGIGIAINTSVYESLKSSGLDKITNSELRNKITKFYEISLNSIDFWINTFILRQLNKRNDLLFEKFPIAINPNPNSGIETTYRISHDFLHKNPDFDKFLFLAGGYFSIAERQITNGMGGLNALIKDIEKELKD